MKGRSVIMRDNYWLTGYLLHVFVKLHEFVWIIFSDLSFGVRWWMYGLSHHLLNIESKCLLTSKFFDPRQIWFHWHDNKDLSLFIEFNLRWTLKFQSSCSGYLIYILVFLWNRDWSGIGIVILCLDDLVCISYYVDCLKFTVISTISVRKKTLDTCYDQRWCKMTFVNEMFEYHVDNMCICVNLV